jgi:arginine/lysine/ornithine decarboxylase
LTGKNTLQPKKIILVDREKHSLQHRKIILADREKHSPT